MRKELLATIQIKDIGRCKYENREKITHLIFEEKYLIERFQERLRKVSDTAKLELGILLDNGSAFYLNIQKIRWNERRTRCQLIIKFRNEAEKERLINLYQIMRMNRQDMANPIDLDSFTVLL